VAATDDRRLGPVDPEPKLMEPVPPDSSAPEPVEPPLAGAPEEDPDPTDVAPADLEPELPEPVEPEPVDSEPVDSEPGAAGESEPDSAGPPQSDSAEPAAETAAEAETEERETEEPEESAEWAEVVDPQDEHRVPMLLVCAIALGLLLMIMGATILFQHAGGFVEVNGLQCRGGNVVAVNEDLPTPLESPEATIPVAARAAGLPERAGWARVSESADAVEFRLTKDGRPFATISTKHVTPADGYPSAGWTVTGLIRCAN
jgi:hypothetical protein